MTSRASFVVRARERQLFVDDHDIASVDKLRSTMHSPAKKGAVVRPNVALGVDTVQTRSAPAWDPSDLRFKLWTFASVPTDLAWDAEAGWIGLYNESADGLHWTQPPLHQVSHRGSTDNSFVSLRLHGKHAVPEAVVRDPSDSDPARRFKGWTWLRSNVVQPIVSDGVAWKPLDCPGIPSQDEFNLFYDAQGAQFIGTVKHRARWGRAVSLTTSPDFGSWTTPEPIFEADDEDQERAAASIRARLANPMFNQPTSNDPAEYGADVYNMGLFRYESVFLGFPAFFHHTGRNAKGNNHDGFHLVQLVVSRDARSWQRVGDRQPFISSSPLGAGAYDLTQILGPSSSIVRDDELWFYYTGIKYREVGEPSEPDRGAICLAVLRRDGFVSLDADSTGGDITTRPFTAPADRLFVNLQASRGQIRVHALDAAGDTIATSVPLTGDQTRAAVRWSGGSIEALKGKQVSLRFVLRDAQLYSYWLADLRDQ